MRTWLGSIIFAYKTNPYRVLILQNKETGNITPPSGAIEPNETLQEAASRELQEELGWTISPEQLHPTSIKQEFVYGPQKKERAGDKGINQVLLLDATHLPEPQETQDTKEAKWLSLEEVQKQITFEDLRQVMRETAELLMSPQNKEVK